LLGADEGEMGKMRWFDGLERVLRGTPGILCPVFGLACAFTCLHGMRLNALDGYYPIEVSLIVRHLLAAAVSLLAVLAYRRRANAYTLSKSWRLVAVVSACLCVSILMRYSDHLLMASTPALVLTGKLFEEALCVLLILVWAERVLPHGFKATATVLALAIVCFASLQLLFSFFQKVPCMFVLATLPLASAALFRLHMALRPEFYNKPVPVAATNVRDAGMAVDLGSKKMMLLYFGLLFCFVYVAGQMVYPTLEIQQGRVLGQVSIAFGNALGGAILLVVADKVELFKTQPRIVFLVAFFTAFALNSVAFALIGHLNTSSTVLYLILSSASTQFNAMLIWITPFAAAGAGSWSPFAMIALGYACSFISRTVSSCSLLMTELFASYPFGVVLGSVLLVSFVVCMVFVMGVSDEKAPEPSAWSTDAAGAATPFKDAIASLVVDYGLTAQEGRVLDLCAKGKNAQGIAEEMTVSPNTAKSHLRALYAKLDVHSQQEVIKLVDDVFKKSRD